MRAKATRRAQRPSYQQRDQFPFKGPISPLRQLAVVGVAAMALRQSKPPVVKVRLPATRKPILTLADHCKPKRIAAAPLHQRAWISGKRNIKHHHPRIKRDSNSIVSSSR